MRLTRQLTSLLRRRQQRAASSDLGASQSVQGWAVGVQKQANLVFVKLSEGSSKPPIQLVVPKELKSDVRVGSALVASGKWTTSQGAQQDVEFVVDHVDVVGHDSNPRYDSLSADNLRRNIHLRGRSDSFAAFLRARSRIFHRTHNFFEKKGFVHIDTPILTRNDCEGGGEVFSLQNDEKDEPPVYLTVSSQLHLEAMCSRLPKVYTLNTALRAEKQQSHVHLSEFRMLEAEVAFCHDVGPICDLVEEYAKDVISSVVDDDEMLLETSKMGVLQESFDATHLRRMLSGCWPRIMYADAVQTLQKCGENVSPKGLNKKNELRLVAEYGGPVFVTHFPAAQKPAYMKRSANGEDTLSFDLLCPLVGELAGGSAREDDADELTKRGFDVNWYLELRRRGQPPTAGFGIGFERLLQLLFSVKNIKDTTPFPRWHRHCQC